MPGDLFFLPFKTIFCEVGYEKHYSFSNGYGAIVYVLTDGDAQGYAEITPCTSSNETLSQLQKTNTMPGFSDSVELLPGAWDGETRCRIQDILQEVYALPSRLAGAPPVNDQCD